MNGRIIIRLQLSTPALRKAAPSLGNNREDAQVFDCTAQLLTNRCRDTFADEALRGPSVLNTPFYLQQPFRAGRVILTLMQLLTTGPHYQVDR